MIDEIRIDGILQIPAAVVGQEYVYRLATGIGLVVCRFDGMIDGMYDIGMRGEEGVSFNFFEGERDGLLAERAADLFESVESRGGGFLD